MPDPKARALGAWPSPCGMAKRSAAMLSLQALADQIEQFAHAVGVRVLAECSTLAGLGNRSAFGHVKQRVTDLLDALVITGIS